MSDTDLKLWEFADAPPALRAGIPAPDADGILIQVLPGGSNEVVDYLIARWTLMGFTVVRHQREDGGIVLAGPAPASY